MSSFLEAMARGSRLRADESARRRSLEETRDAVLAGEPPRPLDRFGETFDLIAELKPRSPSGGSFPERDPLTVARGYEAGGAAMLSVLTEPGSFGGSLAQLRTVSRSVDLPVMAKDFLVDPYQVYEARDAGADGVLVIARILPDDVLTAILDAAGEIGMFVLLEAFDRADLRRLSTVVHERREVLVGINCRDLDTLQVDPALHDDLAGNLPRGRVTVAESSLGDASDIERVAGFGYRAALVGTALMRSPDPVRLVRDMVEAGRRAVAVRT